MASNILPFPRRPANDDDPSTLPPNPHTAVFLGLAYRRLGGDFSIGSRGQRYMGRPELSGCGAGSIPQMPRVKSHEFFHTPEEWGGAVKLLEALIRRLPTCDQDFLYEVMAEPSIDPRAFTPSIEEPKRRAA